MGYWEDNGYGANNMGDKIMDPGGFFKKKTIKENPQITEMRDLLATLAKTGKFGKFDAGAEVPLGYGDFNMTSQEQQGLSSLQSLLSSGIPDQFRMGDQALQDLLQTSPESIDKQFTPFKALVDRNTQESLQAQKRAAAFGGNLYSSKTIEGLGNIGAKANETKAAELARLADAYQARKLQAIPLAYQSANNQEALTLGRIDASQRYGSLARNLNDASIKARDAELLRRRQELQIPIQAASGVLGSPWTPPVSNNPMADILKIIGTIFGGIYGGPKGAAAGGAVGGAVGSKLNDSGTYSA